MSIGQRDFHFKPQRKKPTVHPLEIISELQHITALQSVSLKAICMFSGTVFITQVII